MSRSSKIYTLLMVVVGLCVCRPAPASTYYVDASRPDNSGAGTSWATAKKTIQAAINVSTANDTIIVTNGTYGPISSTNQSITIQSVNGANQTIIDGGGVGRCASLGSTYSHRNTVLKGFTIQNGRIDHEGGMLDGYDGDVGAGSRGGTFYNCTFTNNWAKYGGGGVFSANLYDCVLVDNYAYRGGAAKGSTLSRCLVINNNAEWTGGGIDDTLANNCIIVGNSSQHGGAADHGTLNNCTVVKNQASVGALYSSTANNCIIYGTIGTSPFGGTPVTKNCFTSNPLFVNAANGDYRLMPTSSCINAGNNSLVESDVDFDNKVRIHDGTVDIGAYEYIPSTVTFDAQRGTPPVPASKSVGYGSTYGTLATTTRSACTFAGWWTEVNGAGFEVTPSTPVTFTSDHILYAKWGTDAFDVLNGSVSEPVDASSAVNPSTENSGDGETSVKLGGVGLLGDGEMAGLEWSVTGPGFVGFDWKVSSEQDWDVLSFYEVGVGETNKISGTGQGWTRVSIEVPGDAATSHVFRWEYEKDPIGDYVGDDAGWVDAITWTPKFTLAVEAGNGDGWYTNGTAIAISADAPAPHYEFDRWTGDTNGVEDIFSAVTTLAMPFTNVALAATYKPVLYPLTVANGSGSGGYPYGGLVEIAASNLAGKQFYRWTGDVEVVASAASATTTVTMPDFPISIVATYTVPLTVNDGSGSGWHLEGSAVTVTADPDPLYMEFAGWAGDAAAFLEDATSPTTTLTIPTTPSTLTATYRDSIARVSGSYGRTYTQSGTVNGISTDAAAGAPSGNAAVKLGGTGVVPDNGFAAFETVVQGSGSITFWWKSSSEVNDYLRFLVDGVQVSAISGTKTPWTWVSNRVEGAGVEHALRWEYLKNGSTSSSTDAAWVDDIVWIGDVPMPFIIPDFSSTTANDSGFKFSFWGERGIPYFIYMKTDLHAPSWLPSAAILREVCEVNGMFLYEASVAMPSTQAAGFYRVTTLQTIPYGMKLISAGTNSGTDPDFGAYSLTVSSFYMDTTEVTKALWDQVYTWAIVHGYSFDNAGSGKAENHPVHTVNWYDCIKWCNARSEMEGRPAVYTVNGSVYRTGQSDNVVQTSACGYRLPTEVEWEYAARGGLSGKRFPWGDTIQHERANYFSDSSYSYDTSPTRGNHPDYDNAPKPYTSPVGSFAPNGYGLYDMSGNLWERCFNWSPDYTGSQRVFRGGRWGSIPLGCCVAYRSSESPNLADYSVGFRTVLPAQ